MYIPHGPAVSTPGIHCPQIVIAMLFIIEIKLEMMQMSQNDKYSVYFFATDLKQQTTLPHSLSFSFFPEGLMTK